MDTEHIDISVLFPTGGFGVTQLPEKDYAAAFCRGYNDWIASVCAESPRLKGVGLVPFQDVDAAAKETQRAIGELGLAGITVGTFGMKEHLGQPMYWPIYEQLEKFNVPLLVHNSRQGPAGEIRFDTFLFRHTIGRPFETLLDCAALVYGGVPEKFPKLRIAFLECGCGWVPYWMDRMDEEWEKRQAEAPLLKKKPSEYIHRGQLVFRRRTGREHGAFLFGKGRRRRHFVRFRLSPLGWRFSLYDGNRQRAKRHKRSAKEQNHA